MTTPVLVIAYRRPQHVARVVQALADARPSQLFLACDGPHPERPNERALVEATRRAMEQEINWKCTVRRLYAEENQGCRLGVRNAIDWFFEFVDAGIILEDDCVPHPDFFPFCTELLARYRFDDQVMHISGDGSIRYGGGRGKASYVFSHEALVWGWATWRRAWSHYDADLRQWGELRKDTAQLRKMFRTKDIEEFWSHTLDRLHTSGEPDTWDYQWSFSLRARQGVAILPKANLVTNIGHGMGATHTLDASSSRADVPAEPIFPLVHPRQIRVRAIADQRFQRRLRGLRRSQKIIRHTKLSVRRSRRTASVFVGKVRRLVFSVLGPNETP